MIPADINSYYRLHSGIYDLTRWSFLFGRNSLPALFPDDDGIQTILDLGCGTGKHLKQLASRYPDARITGLDQSREMLDIAGKQLPEHTELLNADYPASLFKRNSIDLIIASYSLSMIPDLENTLENIRYHVRPGGYILVVDFDTSRFGWFRKWMKKNHVVFEADLFGHLEQRFEVEYQITKKGWLGLYTYSTLLARNNT